MATIVRPLWGPQNDLIGLDADGNLVIKANSLIIDNGGTPVTVGATPFALIAGVGRIVDISTATVSLTSADHGDRIVTFNRAAGIAATLPAASGSGAKFTIYIRTTFTSSATVKVANASDIMQGIAIMGGDGGAGAAFTWSTAADSDTITFDGTTTGGYRGTAIELNDIATNQWWVRVSGPASGVEATLFSATV